MAKIGRISNQKIKERSFIYCILTSYSVFKNQQPDSSDKAQFIDLLSLSSDDISNIISKKDIFSEIESDLFLKHLKQLASLWIMISFDLNQGLTKSLFDTTILPDKQRYFEFLEKVQVIYKEDDWQELIGTSLYNEMKKFSFEREVFHWELEFPEIINSGFDAAIGNPPYVDVLENDYIGVPLKSLKSTNLYAYIPEVAYNNLKPNQYLSFITPMAIICSKRMIHLQEIFKNESWFLHNIDSSSNPGCLFKTIKAHLTIINLKKDKKNRIYTSTHRRFFHYERKSVFKEVKYYKLEDESLILGYTIPKISNKIEEEILKILFKSGRSLDLFLLNDNSPGNIMYYKRLNAPYYLFAYDNPPQVSIDGISQKSSTISSIKFKPEFSKYILMSTFFSSLYYWFWIVYSDCYDLHPKDIKRFLLDIAYLNIFSKEFEQLYRNIEKDLEINCETVSYKKAKGLTQYKLFRAKKSKHFFDQVDYFLGSKIGLDKEMINFLINYDSKYRIDEKCQDDN